MIDQILSGQKTQTRRVVRLPRRPSSPYGESGDSLWVRETFNVRTHGDYELVKARLTLEHKNMPIYYKQQDKTADGPWRPSIFMPRWASRINLTVLDVYTEPLQSITEEDAAQEGVRFRSSPSGLLQWESLPSGEFSRTSATAAFMDLWNSINETRGYGWDANPLVWVVKFKLANNQ